MAPKIIKNFEKVVFYFLAFVLMAYIAIEIVELVYQFFIAFSERGDDQRLLITKEQTRIILPIFFNILIAIELIGTFDFYVKESAIKVQSILLIGLIAIGRKLLAYDFTHADGLGNIGLAALILALSVGYYLVKKSDEE